MTEWKNVQRVWKQRTRVCVPGTPVYKLWDLGDDQLLSSGEQGFEEPCSLGGAEARTFMEVPSLSSTTLTGAVSVGQGARPPATAKSQPVPGSEVKGHGCGWCTYALPHT